MSLFKNKKEEVIDLGLPEIPPVREDTLFKITISQITRTKKPKVETEYYDKEEKKLVSSWSRDDDKKARGVYLEVKKFENEFDYKDHEEEIYQQEMQHIDVKDIALYINRAR